MSLPQKSERSLTNDETQLFLRRMTAVMTSTFPRHLKSLFQVSAAAFLSAASPLPALTVESDFEGASVRVVKLDAESHTIRFMPGGDPKRGWPCWWQFRASGLEKGKSLTLELLPSDLPMLQANGTPTDKPLPGNWAMPERAVYSTDGQTWQQTAPGHPREGIMTYTIPVEAPSLLLAWGPSYTPSRAGSFVRDSAARVACTEELDLCKSREGRPVPMLRVCEGDRVESRRFGVWVQARQHAWESGSSWVCQGFAEWLLSDDSEASWLRQHAEIFIVPIMDVDNTATGNGGKEGIPHDHNRDWMEKPNWNEVAAAQNYIRELAKEERMDVFLDLHNPAPNDRKAFFYVLPPELVAEPMRKQRDLFLSFATEEIKSVFPMHDKPKEDGPKYHPLWRQISGTWVSNNANPHTVAVCLETPWNIPQSTVSGYKQVGAKLALAVQRYLVTLKVRS